MKNTIYLILFVLGMILTSATTATIMTVKPALPALPKHVDSGWFSSERSVDEYIKAKVKQGYIIKTMTMSQYSCYVVMEKY